MRFIACESGT